MERQGTDETRRLENAEQAAEKTALNVAYEN
jgi:hypothetical protein